MSEIGTTSATTSASTAGADALSCAIKSDIGRRREENQDAGDIFDGNGFRMFVVCDGMGGVKGGAVASSLAINVIRSNIQNLKEPNEGAIVEAVRLANERIFEEGVTKTALAGMGTTFVGLLFSGSRLLVASVGDSRAYRFRSSKDFRQLTEDHTLVMELIRSGTITPDQAHNHPVSHMLTRSLGPSPEVDVDCYVCRDGPVRGDSYLLCSDGLYNLVSEEEMAAIVLGQDPNQAVDQLVDLANERGGTDNITVIIVKVGESFSVGLEDLPQSATMYSSEAVIPLASKHRPSNQQPSNNGYAMSGAVRSDAISTRSDAASNDSAGERNKPGSDLPATLPVADDGLSRTPRLESKIDLSDAGHNQHRHDDHAVNFEHTGQRHIDQHDSYTRGPEQQQTGANAHSQKSASSESKSVDLSARKNVFGSLVNVALVGACIAIFFLVIRVVSRPADTQVAGTKTSERSVVIDESANDGSVKSEANAAQDSTYLASLNENTRVAFDASSMEALGESQRQQIGRRRELLRARLTDIAEKIHSFDKPLSGNAGRTLADSAGRLLEYQKSLDEVRSKIDVATRKLTVWYGRRKRLQETDPVNLANEVSVSSDEVRIKKDQFEKSTWTYLREAEGLIYNPNDRAQEQKVADLVKQRKAHMSELVDAIRKAIDQAASEANQHVAELTLERDGLQASVETAKLDQLYAKILLGSDQAAKDRILEQLKRERSVIQAELEGLDQLARTDSENQAVPDATVGDEKVEQPEAQQD